MPRIEVAFDIDTNGILCVTARDLDTGAVQSVVITNSERMTDRELSLAIRDAENYERKHR